MARGNPRFGADGGLDGCFIGKTMLLKSASVNIQGHKGSRKNLK
jgi:hypothetical protein